MRFIRSCISLTCAKDDLTRSTPTPSTCMDAVQTLSPSAGSCGCGLMEGLLPKGEETKHVLQFGVEIHGYGGDDLRCMNPCGESVEALNHTYTDHIISMETTHIQVT